MDRWVIMILERLEVLRQGGPCLQGNKGNTSVPFWHVLPAPPTPSVDGCRWYNPRLLTPSAYLKLSGDLPSPSLVADWPLGFCQVFHLIFWPNCPPQDSAEGSLILPCWVSSLILGVTLISLNHLPVSSLEHREKRIRDSELLGFFSSISFLLFLLASFLWEGKGLGCLLLPLGHILLLALSCKTHGFAGWTPSISVLL